MGRLRWNQGCAWIAGMLMRCSGGPTSSRRSRSTHSGESDRAAGISYCTEHIRCESPTTRLRVEDVTV